MPQPPEPAEALFPDATERTEAPLYATGIVPAQDIRALIRERHILSMESISEGQIQPASIDLRLASPAYRVRASFLPGPGVSVREKIDSLTMHEIDLGSGAVLEKGCVYIVPVMESLKLGKRVSGMANPKSSSGRLDVFTRLITDEATEFERVRPAYKGPLYVEISPRAFSIVVREGDSLNQLRIRRGSPPTTDTALRKLHEEIGLVQSDAGEENISKGIAVTVDLRGGAGAASTGGTATIGYRAKRHTDLIDIARVNHYDPRDYWDLIPAEKNSGLTLNPGDFYILASREAITVPPDHAAEMVAYDTLYGEFRVHYAGFFDPGFGFAESGGAGARAVLEIRSHEVPFMLEHGQVVGRLIYERLTDIPDKVYGRDIGSSYQRQGLALAKQFKTLSI